MGSEVVGRASGIQIVEPFDISSDSRRDQLRVDCTIVVRQVDDASLDVADSLHLVALGHLQSSSRTESVQLRVLDLLKHSGRQISSWADVSYLDCDLCSFTRVLREHLARRWECKTRFTGLTLKRGRALNCLR